MIRVLIADSRPERREQWRADLASDAEIEIIGLARDGQEALHLAHLLRPDIAILAAALPVQDGFQTAELLSAARDLPTQTLLISEHMISEHNEPEEMRRAMASGARSHLASSATRAQLLTVVHEIYAAQQRRQTTLFAAHADPQNICRLIAVGGAKGGVGKTTLATNLAVALVQETGEPTVLIDLYTQFGDVAVLLNAVPRRTLADLTSLPLAEVDGQLLYDCMEMHESGLYTLFSATQPIALDAITVPCLENICHWLKQSFRYIVFDVPPILHTTTLFVLAHATRVLLVANLYDLTTLNDTRQLLETLAGNYVAREKLCVILNRVSRQNRLQSLEIERVLGHPITMQIPNDSRIVPASINQGIPFVMTQPGSAITQSIRRLARELSGPLAISSEQEVSQRRESGFWSGLLSPKKARGQA